MPNRPTTSPVPRTPAAPLVSDAALAACAAFGLVPTPGAARRDPVNAAWAAPALEHPGVVLITGPSGCGKSRLLDAITRTTRRRTLTATPVTDDARCAFDAVSPDPARALPALAAAGLAEPALWALPPSCLSTGERARLAIARVIADARPGDLVACDEFASNLDRATAQALGAAVSRWAARAGVTLLLAGAHEDLPDHLDTAAVLRPALRSAQPGRPRRRPPIRIEPGDRRDLDALAHHHYRAGPPASVVRVLRAVRTAPDPSERLAGVLAVSMPTLNASWRPIAWPGRHAGDRRAAAARLNREVRRIARVITAPDSRGLGVARSLVAAYLADPITPCTEAVAAMGCCCPFFKAAGMTEYALPRPPHDARLADALASAGLRPADLLGAQPADPFVQAELSRWARHARVRPAGPDAPRQTAMHAACRLMTTPMAYAHTQGAHP